MSWGKLDSTFARDPKWKRLSVMLRVRRAEAAGLVACLYSWAHDNAPDGNVSEFRDDELEEACLWEGEPLALTKALRDPLLGVLEQTEDGLVIHGIKERAESHKAAQRKQRERERKKSQDGHATQSQDNPVTESRDSHAEREREREERERRASERDPARAENLSEYSVTGADARALIEHWQVQRLTKGESRTLVMPPAWVTSAKAIVAAAGGLEHAKAIVTAYVTSDHDWWVKRRWALGTLEQARDFEQAVLLVGSSAPVDDPEPQPWDDAWPAWHARQAKRGKP